MNDTLRVVETTEEGRSGQIAARSNWLRAGVMGANDGIVSTAGMVVGVAGAAVGSGALLASGVAALVAGALSMAVGEYVSVSSQRDSEASELAAKQAELDREPIEELEELTRLVQTQGLEVGLARRVAEQLTEKDALAAHARLELGLHPDELASRLRGRRDRAAAGDPADPASRRGADHRTRRGRRPGPDGVGLGAPGRLQQAPGCAAHRRRRHGCDGRHLQHRAGGRHPDLTHHRRHDNSPKPRRNRK